VLAGQWADPADTEVNVQWVRDILRPRAVHGAADVGELRGDRPARRGRRLLRTEPEHPTGLSGLSPPDVGAGKVDTASVESTITDEELTELVQRTEPMIERQHSQVGGLPDQDCSLRVTHV
jgi:hypothetical protein